MCWLFAYYPTKNGMGVKAIFWTMLIFSAIRYNVGWDYPAYTKLIEGKMTDSQFERIEWLSRTIMYISRYTFGQVYFILNSVIGMLCLDSIIRKYSKDASLSFFLFLTFSLFYLMTMNVIRNFTAILMVMYACRLFLEKRYWLYLLIIFIASGIHSSAVVGFLLPIVYFLVYKLKVGRWTNIAMFIASFAVGKFIELVVLMFSTNPIFSQVVYYMLNNTEGSGKLYKYIFYLLNLVFLLSWDRLVKEDDRNRFWITLVNIGVCLWVALSFQYTLSLRMALFFIVWLVIILPSLLSTFSLKYSKLFKQITMIIFTTLFFFNLYLLASAYNSGELQQASFLPYQIFLFQ